MENKPQRARDVTAHLSEGLGGKMTPSRGTRRGEEEVGAEGGTARSLRGERAGR